MRNKEHAELTGKRLEQIPNYDSSEGTKKYLSDLEAYFDDQYWGKEFIQREAARFLFYMKSSANPVVAIGENNWLFYISEQDGDPREDIAREMMYTNEQKNNWYQHLRAKKAVLAQKGIEYLFVVAPNKSTVYREFVPSRLKNDSNISRWQDLANYLSGKGEDRFLSLTECLSNAKHDNRGLYSAYGSHWNMLGTAYAYRAIANKLKFSEPELEQIEIILGEIQKMDGIADMDLAKLLVLHNSLKNSDWGIDDGRLYTEKKFLDRDKFGINNGRPFYELQGIAENDRTVLILGDSFGQKLAPYFGLNFGRVVVVWFRPSKKILSELVENFQPELVVEERVERYISLVPGPGF